MNQTNFEEWFKGQQKKLSIDVAEISLSEMNDWNIMEQDGKQSFIGHKSGRFHRGIFLKAWDIAKKDWVERFMLAPIPENEQPYYGIVLLVSYNGKYLVQAKSEPGNWGDGHVQITSTIHTSYTNMKNSPGKIPFISMYDHPECTKFISAQDGAQLYMKNNEVCFLELKEELKEDVPENFIWATKEEIISLSRNGLVSEHVMQCLGASVLYSK